MIKQFVVHTKTDKIVASSYLSKHDWNIGAAFESLTRIIRLKVYILCQLFVCIIVINLINFFEKIVGQTALFYVFTTIPDKKCFIFSY